MTDIPGDQWLLLDVTNPSEYADYVARYYRAVAKLYQLQFEAYHETFRKPPNWPSPVQPRCNPEALPPLPTNPLFRPVPWGVNVREKAVADTAEYLSMNGFERACADERERIRRKPTKGRA